MTLTRRLRSRRRHAGTSSSRARKTGSSTSPAASKVIRRHQGHALAVGEALHHLLVRQRRPDSGYRQRRDETSEQARVRAAGTPCRCRLLRSCRSRRVCQTSATVSVPSVRQLASPEGLATPEREAFAVQHAKRLGLGRPHQRPEPGSQALVADKNVRVVVAPVLAPQRPVDRPGDDLDPLALVVTSEACGPRNRRRRPE